MLVIPVLLLYFVYCVTDSFPVNNEFTVKLHPISRADLKEVKEVKEDLTSTKYGAMFAKIPQESSLVGKLRRETLSEVHFPHAAELGLGCTNQIAKVIYPFKICDHNDTETRGNANNLNLPLVTQPFDKYKILIALAPPMMKIDNKNEPLLIYLVFSGDHTNDLNPLNLPTVYFVNNRKDKINNEEKVRVDPIFIIDSNRTVTGLKSKEIAKYITFRNRLINLLDY